MQALEYASLHSVAYCSISQPNGLRLSHREDPELISRYPAEHTVTVLHGTTVPPTTF
jgi:hypothetical protein